MLFSINLRIIISFWILPSLALYLSPFISSASHDPLALPSLRDHPSRAPLRSSPPRYQINLSHRLSSHNLIRFPLNRQILLPIHLMMH